MLQSKEDLSTLKIVDYGLSSSISQAGD